MQRTDAWHHELPVHFFSHMRRKTCPSTWEEIHGIRKPGQTFDEVIREMVKKDKISDTVRSFVLPSDDAGSKKPWSHRKLELVDREGIFFCSFVENFKPPLAVCACRYRG